MQASADMTVPEQENNSLQSVPVSARRSLVEIIIALGFTALLVWGAQSLMHPATLPIKQVRIEGDFRYLSTALLQERIRNRVTGGFFNVDVAAIRDALLQEPWVSDVSVHRVWPDSLQVYVTEQVPVARWNDSGLLNHHGALFEPQADSIPAQLPLLRGPSFSGELVLEKYRQLSNSLTAVDMAVAELWLDDRRAWHFVTTTGLRVVLGKQAFAERLQRFVQRVPSGLAEKLQAAAEIDLRYPNGFAVRWKDAGELPEQHNGAL